MSKRGKRKFRNKRDKKPKGASKHAINRMAERGILIYPKEVQRKIKKGKAIKGEDGALIVDFKKDNQDIRVIWNPISKEIITVYGLYNRN